MSEIEKQLLELEEQEKELVFKEFNCATALHIGMYIVEKATSLSKKLTVDISKNRQQLFHFSCEGSSPDNDEWIKRKNNVVNRFFKSSLYIGLKLKLQNKSIEEKYLISSSEFAAYGGAFPIIIENTGVIGTITVSGLSQAEDHDFVVEAIREYLGK